MPRYYLISTVIVLILIAIIVVFNKKKSKREIIFLFFIASIGLVVFSGMIYGISYLLKIAGIAERGFVF